MYERSKSTLAIFTRSLVSSCGNCSNALCRHAAAVIRIWKGRMKNRPTLPRWVTSGYECPCLDSRACAKSYQQLRGCSYLVQRCPKPLGINALLKLFLKQEAISNRCHASSKKCLTSSNKKPLETTFCNTTYQLETLGILLASMNRKDARQLRGFKTLHALEENQFQP